MPRMPRDLFAATETLGAALERFDRQVAKAATKPAVRQRVGPLASRLPPTHAHRPTRHPVIHPVIQPVRYRRKPARTALDRARAQDEQRRGGPTPQASAVRRAAGRIADAVRGSLGKVRRGLRRLGGRPVHRR